MSGGVPRVISPGPYTTDQAIVLKYTLNGQTYEQPFTLAPGKNLLTVTLPDGSPATFEETRVSSLVDSTQFGYDVMGNVSSTINGLRRSSTPSSR